VSSKNQRTSKKICTRACIHNTHVRTHTCTFSHRPVTMGTHAYTDTVRQTGRQTDRQTDRQTGRQTHKHTHTHASPKKKHALNTHARERSQIHQQSHPHVTLLTHIPIHIIMLLFIPLYMHIQIIMVLFILLCYCSYYYVIIHIIMLLFKPLYMHT